MANNNSSKKPTLAIIGAIILVSAAIFAFYFVDIDQTKEAMLPDVDLTVKEGQLPQFDVDTGSINIESKAVEIDVPTTDVKMKTIEIEVPVDVDVGTEKSIIEVPTLNIEAPKQDSPSDN